MEAMTEPPSPIEPEHRRAETIESLVVRPAPAGGSGVSANAAAVRIREVVDPFGLRFLVIAWSLWLLVSWSLTLAIGSPVHAVRWVVFSAVFGLMAVWPSVRLSQQLLWPTRRGRMLGVASGGVRLWSTVADWVSLLAVFQVVVWPLMYVGHWSVWQTLWLDLAVVSWSGLTAVLVGLGRLIPTAGARVLAMVLCVLLLLGEPIWLALGGGGAGGGWQMRVSPIQALWELTTTKQPYSPAGWVPAVVSTGLAALLGWVALGVMAAVIGRGPAFSRSGGR